MTYCEFIAIKSFTYLVRPLEGKRVRHSCYIFPLLNDILAEYRILESVFLCINITNILLAYTLASVVSGKKYIFYLMLCLFNYLLLLSPIIDVKIFLYH